MVLDDHRVVVLGLRTLFNSRPEIEVVAWAHDAEEALEACHRHRPSVAVLDVALGGSPVDGIDLCRRLHEELEDVEVVVYTGIEEMGIAERAFAAGARGVVSKGDQASDLLTAVLLAARGRRYMSPVFAAYADRRDFEDLSPKQLVALRLVAQGLERRQIAERMGIGEETVKSHLAEVRRKLGARTSAQAVAIGLLNSIFDLPAADVGVAG